MEENWSIYMELMLIVVYLFSLLKFNISEHVDLPTNFENTTNITFNSFRTIIPVAKTSTWRGNVSFNNFEYGCFNNCLWLKWSYCNYAKNKCVCLSNLVRIGYKCLEERLRLGMSCSDPKQCLVSHSDCILNKCTCKPGYESSFASLSCIEKIEKNTVDIDETCNFRQQCRTPNSDCIGGRCRCKTGYEKYGYRCEVIYDKSSKRVGSTDVILISLSILVIFVIMVVSIAALRKRRSMAESSTVHIPPENISHFPPTNTPVYPIYESSGFHTAYGSELNPNNLDKPPSYEEVIRSSRSTVNLMNNDIQEPSCAIYTNTMNTQRPPSSVS